MESCVKVGRRVSARSVRIAVISICPPRFWAKRLAGDVINEEARNVHQALLKEGFADHQLMLVEQNLEIGAQDGVLLAQVRQPGRPLTLRSLQGTVEVGTQHLPTLDAQSRQDLSSGQIQVVKVTCLFSPRDTSMRSYLERKAGRLG